MTSGRSQMLATRNLDWQAFGADYVKVVEYTPVLTAAEMYRPRNLVFSDISFMAILAGVTPSESDKVRHSALVWENLTNNQP